MHSNSRGITPSIRTTTKKPGCTGRKMSKRINPNGGPMAISSVTSCPRTMTKRPRRRISTGATTSSPRCAICSARRVAYAPCPTVSSSSINGITPSSKSMWSGEGYRSSPTASSSIRMIATPSRMWTWCHSIDSIPMRPLFPSTRPKKIGFRIYPGPARRIGRVPVAKSSRVPSSTPRTALPAGPSSVPTHVTYSQRKTFVSLNGDGMNPHRAIASPQPSSAARRRGAGRLLRTING
mmetsp:Transcript_5880/g.8807  ORF Transcript_5880/g.8807 Transcript_5880/m.8807 type:complete len:237 (+) Transcript_5880:381-1091(+)